MTDDQFLSAHRVHDGNDRLFQLASNISPISVRDQVNRAQAFVKLAIHAGILNKGQSLLIVGAGVAGTTAAIRAAERGIEVLLIDEEVQPFSRVARVSTRSVAPTQYDWPADHWKEDSHPWDDAGQIPYPKWQAGPAQSLFQSWKTAFIKEVRKPGNLLKFRNRTRFKRLSAASKPIEVWFQKKFSDRWIAEPRSMFFDIVVIACGFGRERTFVEKLRHDLDPVRPSVTRAAGPLFWADDHFEDADYGLKTPAKVLISGSGDGALQDYLRIVTHSKIDKPWHILDALDLPHDRLATLRTQESEARKAYIQNGPSSDCRVHTWIHKKHVAMVGEIYPRVARKLAQFVRDDLPSALKLVHWCRHFDNCYPINRFLVLLIAKYLREEHPRRMRTLIPGSAVGWIDCLGSHALPESDPPKDRARACDGQDHVALIARARQCRPGAIEINDRIRRYECNILIVRHGIEPPAILFDKKISNQAGLAPASRPIRQAAPGLDLS